MIQFIIVSKEPRVTLSALDRLAHKVWARRLRTSAVELRHAGLLPAGAKQWADTWTWLASQLVGVEDPATADGERFQGLFNVVAKGSNPRKVLRRIRVCDVSQQVANQGRVAGRRPSGRTAKGHGRDRTTIQYVEVPVDLVSRGDSLVAGSSRWLDSQLWQLAAESRQPELEPTRCLIRSLLRTHGLCRMPRAGRALAGQAGEIRAHGECSVTRYRQSLAPAVCSLHPDSICLLAALTLESFIIGATDLFDLHRTLLCDQIDRLLSDQNMTDVREDFLTLVAEKLVNMEWGEPLAFTAVSIDCPLVPIPEGIERFPLI